VAARATGVAGAVTAATTESSRRSTNAHPRYSAGVRAAFRTLPALLAAVAAAALLAGCGGSGAARAEPSIRPSEPFSEVRRVTLQGPEGASRTLWAWVADTDEKRQLGLMHRTELADDAGMLFVFDAEHSGGFWMKNTRIPLSIAYIGGDGTILRIMDMEPCRRDPCPTYDPGKPYHMALEANRGWFDQAGVTGGWTLSVEKVR
jgi:uncharacterized membrane protein (UPF0127 family)